MSLVISAHIGKQKKQIRRSQLEHFFASKRGMVTQLDSKKVESQLMPHLDILKNFAVYEYNIPKLKESLLKIKQIISTYDILKILMQNIIVNSSNLFTMKYHHSYENEMTWIDLILQLLKSGIEDGIITENCSGILSECASFLKNRIVRKRYFQNENQNERQCMRLVSNYPYQLIFQGNTQTVKNSLQFVSQIVQTSRNGRILYSIITRKRNIIEIINQLWNRVNQLKDIQISELKNEVHHTSIILIYFISRYNYIKQVGANNFSHCVEDSKKYLFERLKQSQSMEEFGDNCTKFIPFLHVVASSLKKDEFEFIQSVIERQINHKNLPFFAMLSTIMKNFVQTLQIHNLRLILAELFTISQSNDKEFSLKKYLLEIYHFHIINSGNYFKSEDVEMFIGFCGQYSKADRLIQLIQFLDGTPEYNMIKQLSDLVRKVLNKNEMNYINFQITPFEYQQLVQFQQFKSIFDKDSENSEEQVL